MEDSHSYGCGQRSPNLGPASGLDLELTDAHKEEGGSALCILHKNSVSRAFWSPVQRSDD